MRLPTVVALVGHMSEERRQAHTLVSHNCSNKSQRNNKKESCIFLS